MTKKPSVGYDKENLTNPEIREQYTGEIKSDAYGRKIPKHAHGTANIGRFTSSTKLISETVLKLYDEIVQYAKEHLPEESCGLIAGEIDGDNKTIKKVIKNHIDKDVPKYV